MRFFWLFLIGLLPSVLHAQNLNPAILKSIKSHHFHVHYPYDLTLNLDDKPMTRTCAHRHAIASSFRNMKSFEQALQETNWDPCCLLKETLDRIDRHRNSNTPITGMAFGITFGGSVVVDGVAYRELVLIFNEKDSFELTLVTAVEGGLSLSLPLAAGVTTSFLTGCNNVQDYLGYFISATAGGITKNTGVSSLNPLTAHKTGCNSLTINDGSSTQVVGVASSKWMQKSPTIRVTGARARRLIQFMTDRTMSRRRLQCG
jgi:hypothetical protein